jgi:hypothetical protein
MRSMVEGASGSTARTLTCVVVGPPRAPPTILRADALRMVPPPRWRGAG